jgi:hypothetical protein
MLSINNLKWSLIETPHLLPAKQLLYGHIFFPNPEGIEYD